jgi:ribonuclease-3
MNKLNGLHNKTQEIAVYDLPFNPNNVLLSKEDLCSFLEIGDIKDVHNINLYRTAFVHRSYCTMKNTGFEAGNERCPDNCLPLQDVSYERLEFLGDAVLGMVVARYLYERYPDQSEGFLSRMRTKIVNGKSLGALSNKIGFARFAIISKQIEATQGRDNYKTMEDVFEAFIGAICMDQSSDVAEQWLINVLEKHIDFADLIQAKTNYKDMLVRYMQGTYQDNPRFYEVSVDIRNNHKVFRYCVKNKAGTVLGVAAAASKKDAENAAALAALNYFGVKVDNVVMA